MAQVPVNAESSMTPGFGAFLVVVRTKDRPFKLRRRQLFLAPAAAQPGR